ncbi:MAG: hypothetical protein ACFFAS_06810 [Promethearchaeota archaeon]
MEFKVELKEVSSQPISTIIEEVRAFKIHLIFPKLMKEIFEFLEKENIKVKSVPVANFTDWKRDKGKMVVGVPIETQFDSNGRISASQSIPLEVL